MLYTDGNDDKKFQSPLFYRSRDNQFLKKRLKSSWKAVLLLLMFYTQLSSIFIGILKSWNFQPSLFYRSRENQLWKIKAAKKLLKYSLPAIDVLYLIMLQTDKNVNKKFHPSLFTGAEKISLKNKSCWKAVWPLLMFYT